MSESERPPRLKVVGGKEHKPVEEKPSANQPVGEKGEGSVTPQMLLDLWNKVVNNLPADYAMVTNYPAKIEEAKIVRAYTVEQLYTCLSGPDVWGKPILARAALEEVNRRRKINNFSPEES